MVRNLPVAEASRSRAAQQLTAGLSDTWLQAAMAAERRAATVAAGRQTARSRTAARGGQASGGAGRRGRAEGTALV